MKIEEYSSLFDIKNDVVVLTGAAGYLGTRFAHVLSKNGANVILVDSDAKKCSLLEKTLRKKYQTNPMHFSINIENKSSVNDITKKIIKNYKKIDALVNNAHFVPRTSPNRDSPFEEYPLDLWQKTIDTNLTGTFVCSQEIGKIMSKKRNGVIVNISSIYGLVGSDQRIYGTSRLNTPASYAATKAGIVNLTRYLAAYWHKKNIRVNTLTLGGVFNSKVHKKEFVKNYSKKTILGRMASINDFDGSIIFLLSNASSYMTGSNLVVDGGWTSW